MVDDEGPSEIPNEDSENPSERSERHNKRWSREEEAVVIESWLKGESWEEIAEKTRRSPSAVRTRLAIILTERRDVVRKTTAATGSRKPPKDPRFDPKMSIPGAGIPPRKPPVYPFPEDYWRMICHSLWLGSQTDESEDDGTDADESCCPECQKPLGRRCNFCGIPE